MHEFLKTSPFDLYELYLFHLVAKHRSFTKAAEVAGLTQSAITRQMLTSLGVRVEAAEEPLPRRAFVVHKRTVLASDRSARILGRNDATHRTPSRAQLRCTRTEDPESAHNQYADECTNLPR